MHKMPSISIAPLRSQLLGSPLAAYEREATSVEHSRRICIQCFIGLAKAKIELGLGFMLYKLSPSHQDRWEQTLNKIHARFILYTH